MSERDLLMIPGPIVFDPAVLRAMSRPTESHTAASFIEVFGRTLQNLHSVFLSPNGQPFVMAGSGSLAMDMAATNLIEPGDDVLVISTGYFSDRFAAIAERYGGRIQKLTAPLGDVVPLSEIESALQGASVQGGHRHSRGYVDGSRHRREGHRRFGRKIRRAQHR